MSSTNLANGAFVTTVQGKRCTAVPKSGGGDDGGGGGNGDNGNGNNGNGDNGGNDGNENAGADATSQSIVQNTAVLSAAGVAPTTTSLGESSTSTTTSSSLTDAFPVTSNTFIPFNISNTPVASTSPSISTTTSPLSQLQTAAFQPFALAPDPAPGSNSQPDSSSVPSTSTSVDSPASPSQADFVAQAEPSSTSSPSSSSSSSSSSSPESSSETSQTDTSKPTAPEATSEDILQQPTSSLPPPGQDGSPASEDAGGNARLTAAGADPTRPPQSSDDTAAQPTGPVISTNGAASAMMGSGGDAVRSTVAIAGGVIGGVIALSIVAFLIWWWRRRVQKKRRSTLLTPLTTDDMPGGRDGEKRPYVIDRSSVGPTPVSTKLRNAITYKMKRFRNQFRSGGGDPGAPAVNMNRGNSQFMDPVNTHSRGNSSAFNPRDTQITTKDRFMDWWSRLTSDASFTWRVRNDNSNNTNEPFSASRGVNEKKPAPASQPDFLTLLSMDERELDREAQRRRASASRKNNSAGSRDQFLGGLNLSFGGSNSNLNDPFSDDNAARSSATPAPLAVSQANNPFSDANAISNPAPVVPKPTTYVADIRRSRNQSVSGNGNPPPGGVVRESVASVESYTTRRNNKFRSDPFDLERPELLASARQAKASISSRVTENSQESRLSGGVGTGDIRRPPGAHARSESFSSKYSSGVSMGDWSDPGPDVGPAASRKDGSDSGTNQKKPKRQSSASDSVGKAM